MTHVGIETRTEVWHNIRRTATGLFAPGRFRAISSGLVGNNSWNEAYVSGNVPWDPGPYDPFPSPFADRWYGEPFEFLIDRRFFHLHTGHAEQREFTRTAADLLSPGRAWYSLIASAKSGQGTGGPPRWSEVDVGAAAGAQFRIKHLIETEFTPGEGSSMPAWIAVFRRAATPT